MWYLTVVLASIFLTTNDVRQLFTCFLAICVPSPEKCYSSLLPILQIGYLHLYLWVVRVLCISCAQVPYHIYDLKILSHIILVILSHSCWYLLKHKIFYLWWSSINLLFDFVACYHSQETIAWLKVYYVVYYQVLMLFLKSQYTFFKVIIHRQGHRHKHRTQENLGSSRGLSTETPALSFRILSFD